MRFNKGDLKKILFYPLRALISKEFYFEVLFSMKGVGVLYLFLLSTVLAVPAAYRSSDVLTFFKDLELPRLIAQLPASYLDKNGILTTNSQEESFKLIKNSRGTPAIIFNVEDRPLSGEAADAPVEFNSTFIRVHTEKGDADIEYRGIFETGSDFSPTYTAQAVEQVLSATPRVLWAVMVVWFMSLLGINAMISGALGRFLVLFVFRIRIGFSSALRLASFANTAVALLVLAQFYVYLPIGYTVMVIIPLLYLAWFARGFRKELEALGLDAFKAKYSSATRYEAPSAHDYATKVQNESAPQKADDVAAGMGEGNTQADPEDKKKDGQSAKAPDQKKNDKYDGNSGTFEA